MLFGRSHVQILQSKILLDSATGDIRYEAVLRSMNQRFPHLAEKLRRLSDLSRRAKLKKYVKSKKHANKLQLARSKSPSTPTSDKNKTNQ